MMMFYFNTTKISGGFRIDAREYIFKKFRDQGAKPRQGVWLRQNPRS